MLQKVTDVIDRNGEAQAFPKDFHVGDAGHFSWQIEQCPAAVARIDLGGRLNVELALELAGLGADNSFGDGPFESQRTADGKYSFSHGQIIRITQGHPNKLWG